MGYFYSIAVRKCGGLAYHSLSVGRTSRRDRLPTFSGAFRWRGGPLGGLHGSPSGYSKKRTPLRAGSRTRGRRALGVGGAGQELGVLGRVAVMTVGITSGLSMTGREKSGVAGKVGKRGKCRGMWGLGKVVGAVTG